MSKKALEQKVEELQQQVQEGIEAQYQVGWCFKNGKGVEKDNRRAMECWKRAAVLGHAKAKHFLNEMMAAYGDSDNSDEVGAAILAAEPGEHDVEDGDGQYHLGECYSDGKGGVQKNALMAVEWWKKAAKNGNVDAIHKLGICYRDGYGVEQADDTQAVQWLEWAATKGHAEARYNLAECLRFAQGVPKKNLKRAVELYELAANEGNLAEAQNALGHIFSLGEKTRGRGGTMIAKDATKGAAYWKMAAEQGHKDAQINMAMCYRLGWGVVKDYYQAVVWLHKAVQQKCKKAGHNDLESLVHELLQGKFKDGNHEKALTYCAQHGLGSIEKDSEQAKKILNRLNGAEQEDKRKSDIGEVDAEDEPEKKKAKTDASDDSEQADAAGEGTVDSQVPGGI